MKLVPGIKRIENHRDAFSKKNLLGEGGADDSNIEYIETFN